MCWAKRGADALAHRQVFQRDIGLAERGAMLIAPGDVEGLAVFFQAEGPAALAGDGAETVGLVDVLDPRDGGEFEAGLAGVGEELERTGADHGVVGDDLGGCEVALEVGVLHELHVAEVGEAFAADGIAGRVDAGVGIDAGEVVDGVGVLAAGEAADGDAPGIAIVLLGVGGEFGADPGDGLLALRVVGLRHAFGRHAVLFEHGGHFSPGCESSRPRRLARSTVAGLHPPWVYAPPWH